ncbi:MAG TPA: CoA ester lyase [Thermodesulfobacteriota bacterium]|nr:CoA ester lyase [Thermodesulfobacteriota bacterium]
MRLRRSVLAAPGSREKMIRRAVESAADEVFLDLEDAVAPGEKVKSRARVVEALRGLDWRGKIRAVRINDLRSPLAYRDLVEIVEGAGAQLDCVLIPKVRSADEVRFVDRLLTMIEAALGLPHRIGIEPQIEDSQGLREVYAIAAASPRVEAVVWGPGDYAAATGIRMLSIGAHLRAYPGHVWHHPMSEVNAAAKAAGAAAIDGPYALFRDPAGLEESARLAALLGFDGKWAIHPSQIEPLNRIFTPSREEIERARAILDAYAKALAQGAGATAFEDELVDAASARMAERVLEKARLAGVL